jgi:hypothetical protein
MMDQNIQAAPEQEQQAPVVDQIPEQSQQTAVDIYEEQAREQGWRPKEEWDGDPDKWRPAKEFVERGELFGKIDHMGRELKETRKALKMLQEHHTKVKETEFKRAVDELKALQKKHLEEGNSDGYLETSELLTDLKAEQKAREAVAEVTPNQPHPDFVQWVNANKWYNADVEMHDYADAVGLRYAQNNPHLEPNEVLTYVSQQVRNRFKERFVNPNRSKPSAVEGSNNTESPKKDSFKLTDEERKVMHTFVRTGTMSEKEYIDEVKRMRGVA